MLGWSLWATNRLTRRDKNRSVDDFWLCDIFGIKTTCVSVHGLATAVWWKSCHKMKRVVSHTKQCKRKSNGGCPICKQLIALCCYHAKMCQEAKCPVPFCQSIKQKLKQQQLQQRLQEAAMMRRRIAQMNSRMNIGNSGPEPAQKPQVREEDNLLELWVIVKIHKVLYI